MLTAPRAHAAPLNLRQIEVFHAIMKTGSLSEAGRILCVSQPAISRVLAATENRLRFPLFDRVKGRLQPTPEARLLFAEAHAIQEGVDRFNSMARSLAEGTQGKLSIVSSPSHSEWLMPQAINRFRARHPDVPIKYRPLPFDSLVPHVLLGHADLGISSIAPPQSTNLLAREIGEATVVCAVPRGHPLANVEAVTADHLVGQTFIGYGHDTPFGQMLSEFLRTQGGQITPDIETRSTPEALALVRQGVGVALVDSYGYTPGKQDELILKPLSPAPVHKIYAVQARQTPISTLAKSFLATLRNVLQREDAAVPALDEVS